MEIKVNNASDFQRDTDNFPEGSVLSIRYGSTRRQVPISALHDHSLKFPEERKEEKGPLRIDVLRPVCRRTQTLTQKEERYSFKFNFGGVEKECVLVCSNNRALNGQKQVVEPPERDTTQYKDAAKVARGYLEQHRLLEYFQELLHAVIQEKPDDPKRFIHEQIGSLLPDGAKQGMRGGSDDNLSQAHLKQIEEAENIRQQLEQELKALNERVANLAKRLQAERTANIERAQANAGEPGEIEQLRSFKAEHEQKIAEAVEAERKKSEAQLAQIDSAEKLRNELEVLVTRLTERVKRLGELQAEQNKKALLRDAEIVELKRKLQEQPQASTDAASPSQGQPDFQELEKEFKTKFSDAEKSRTELEERVTGIKQRVDRLKDAGAAGSGAPAGTDTEALRTKLESEEKRAEELKASVQDLQARVVTLTDEKDSAEREAFKTANETLQRAEEGRKNLEEEIGDLKRRLDGVLARQAQMTERAMPAPPLPPGSLPLGALPPGFIMPIGVAPVSSSASGLPLPPGFSTASQLPSSQAGAAPSTEEEEKLKSFVREQIMAKAASGDLKNAFDAITSKQDASSSVEATRVDLRNGFEAAWGNGSLSQRMDEATGLQAARAQIKEGVEKLLDTGKLQELLKKGVPQDEDFNNLKQGVEKALESGELQQQLGKGVPQQKDYTDLIKERLTASAMNQTLTGLVTQAQATAQAKPS